MNEGKKDNVSQTGQYGENPFILEKDKEDADNIMEDEESSN